MGSVTTKDLKEPHLPRQVGRVEMQRQAERRTEVVWHREVAAVAEWAWVVPHSCVVDKNQEGYLGSK